MHTALKPYQTFASKVFIPNRSGNWNILENSLQLIFNSFLFYKKWWTPQQVQCQKYRKIKRATMTQWLQLTRYLARRKTTYKSYRDICAFTVTQTMIYLLQYYYHASWSIEIIFKFWPTLSISLLKHKFLPLLSPKLNYWNKCWQSINFSLIL